MTSSKPTWLLRGGRVIDPGSGRDEVADVLVRDGNVVAIDADLTATGAEVVDCGGLVVAPGFVDAHVHLRDPGLTHKETVATGTAAAAAGGFTAVCCMPNTDPVLDSVEALAGLAEVVGRDAAVRVHPIAAITRGRAGAEGLDYAALVGAGAVGFSDDGDSTADSLLMRRVLEASVALDRPVMVHCEDRALASGAMHEGYIAAQLGVPSIPPEAEEIILARDIMLARLTGGRLHACHVSTGRGIDLVRQAKADGVRVTAEVMPHHLTMSDAWVAGERTLQNAWEPVGPRPDVIPDPLAKVNPPLRGAADTRALLRALQDGTFDIVATDHAPHTLEEKTSVPFAAAPNGLSGLELALPLMMALVRAGHLTLPTLVDKLSTAPARLLGLKGGRLAPGTAGDVVVFAPEERWTVTPEALRTKSPNTPLLGTEVGGRVCLTLVGGEERYRA